MNRKKIYLACPYSHEDPIVRSNRFFVANKVAAHLIQQGFIVFSPISHSHSICVQKGFPYEYSYWKDQDESFIQWCDEVYIILEDGWEKSVGVREESFLAVENQKSIRYIDPKTFEVIDGIRYWSNPD